MAVVYRAQDQRLGREVAVKVLRAQYASDPGFVERFEREARSAAALTHPHIASVHDTGEDSGCHYIVMELLPPKTLKDLIEARGPLSVAEALDIAIQVARALQYAHDRGLVHRDIKPHNILFTSEGSVKVTDFGIARALASDPMTETGTILGSVHYLSPEQAQGQPATPQSDLYSLGVVLYEMVTGKRPYEGETPVAVALQHVRGQRLRARQRRPDLPPAVDELIEKAMNPNPAARFQSAQEMLTALKRVQSQPDLERTSVLAKPVDQTTVLEATVRQPPEDRIATSPRTSAPLDRVSEARRGSPALTVGLVLLGLLLSGLALAWGAGWLKWGGLGQPVQEELAPPPPPQLVEVPDITGLDRVQLNTRFEDSEWQFVPSGQEESEEPEGTIVRQEPPAGTQVEVGNNIIRYWTSTGVVKVAVPDVTKMLVERARETLESQGLRLGQVKEETSAEVPKGVVIRQSKEADSRVEKGAAVDVVVSLGPPEPSPSPTPPAPPAPAPKPEFVTAKAVDEETGLRVIRVLIDVPEDGPGRQIRILKTDDRVRDEEVYNAELAPGQEQTEQIEGEGPVTLQFFVDGELEDTRTF